MNKYAIFFILGLCGSNLYANYWHASPLGIPSYSKNLQKIESERFTLIFDSFLHPKLAKLYAFFLERSFASLTNSKSFFPSLHIYSPNKKYKKFPIILSQYSSIGNAYVNHMFERSFLELHAPGPDPLLFPWEALVSIHEIRHVLQSQIIKNSFLYKCTHWLVGPFYAQRYVEIGLPYWFIEGDAVFWETKFSSFGRGHKSSFLKSFLLTVKNRKKHSYYQDVLKSRNFTSWGKSLLSPYVMGYFFSKYFVDNYGSETYTKILYDTTQKTSWTGLGLSTLFGFELAVLKHTKTHLHIHYKKMIEEIKKQPVISEISITTTPVLQQNLTKIKSDFIPIKQLPGKNLLAFQLRKFDYNRFVEILPNGTINPIKTIFGLHSEIPLHKCIKMGTKYIVVAEDHPHFRWGDHDGLKNSKSSSHGKNNADLVLYEYPSWKKSSLIKNRKVMSFAISPDDKYIVFIEQKFTGEKQLILFNIATKQEKILLDGFFGKIIQLPIWSVDSKKIFFLQQNIENIVSSLFELIQIDIKKPIPKVILETGVPFFPLTTSQKYLFYSVNNVADSGIFAIEIDNPSQNFKIIDDSFFYSQNILLLSSDETSVFLMRENASKYLHIHTTYLDKKNWLKKPFHKISNPILNNIEKNSFFPSKFIIENYRPTFNQLMRPVSWGIFSGKLPNADNYDPFSYNTELHSTYGLMLETADQIGSLSSRWQILFHPEKYILSELISFSYLASTPTFDIKLINQNQFSQKKQILKKTTRLTKNKRIFSHSGAISLIINPKIPLSFHINPGIYQLEFELPSSGTMVYDANIKAGEEIPSIFYQLQINPKIHNSFFFIPYGSKRNYLELSFHLDVKFRILENFNQPLFLLRDPSQPTNFNEVNLFPKEKFQFGGTFFFSFPVFYKYDRSDFILAFKENSYLETKLITKIRYSAPIFINWSLGPVLGLEETLLSISIKNQMSFSSPINQISPPKNENYYKKITRIEIATDPKFIILPSSRSGVSFRLRIGISFNFIESKKPVIQPLFHFNFLI